LGVIYKAVNITNGKCYVGQAQSFARRKKDHKCYYTKKKTRFYSAIKKYGWDNFEWFEIDRADSQEDLNQKEIFWIAELNSIHPNGYNLRDGGQNGGGLSGVNNPKHKTVDIELLKRLHFEEKKSLTEMEKIVGLARHTIARKLKAANIKSIRHDNRKDIFDQEIIRLYVDEKLSLEKISKILKIGATSVLNRLRRNGINTEYEKIKLDEKYLKKLYLEKDMSVRQIVAITGLTRGPISRLVTEKQWNKTKNK
jgi:group I intron endonuclease